MIKKLMMLCVAVMAAMGAWAATETVNGIKWTYTVSDGKASVGGEPGYSTAVSKSSSGAIIIPSTLGGYPVVSIKACAFENCSSLTSVTIPDGVTSIGGAAFYGCSSLANVSIPDSVTSVGNNNVFYGCDSNLYDTTTILGVTLVDGWAVDSDDSSLPGNLDLIGVRGIGPYAFSGCSSLTSITIGDGVTSIGENPFHGCVSLQNIVVDQANNNYKSIDGFLLSNDGKVFIACPASKVCVTIPDSVTSIGEWAFSNSSSLTNVTIPDSVTSIGSSAFYGCHSLTNVTIPDSVTSIGNSAFELCSSLASVTIGNSVTNIGSHAFEGCDLTNVTIPDSVTSIGNYAFEGCDLTNVTIPDSVTSIGNYAFEDCHSLTNVTIGDGVTSIGEHAFCDCSSLESVTIGSSVTSIGSRAFYDCWSLKEVHITDVEKWCRISFKGDSDQPLLYARNLYLFDEKIVELAIPNSVTNIMPYAFYGCDSLERVTISDGVTSIGREAFFGCSSLTSVTIPGSVTSIGVRAFDVCNAGLYDTTTMPGIKLVDGWAVDSDDSLYGILDLTGVRGIAGTAFSYCSSLTSVTIPNSVTSIGVNTFYGCSSLTSVTIPGSVTSIGECAFYDCSSLTSVTIGDNVTSIHSRAFVGCDSIRSVTIPQSVCDFELDSVFRSSYKSITNVVFQGTVTNIGDYAVENCSSLTSVTIPNSVTSIGVNTFSGCSSLTSVTIPDSVTSIGRGAFSGCSSLTSVTIGDGVTSIGQQAFYGCGKNYVFLGDAPVGRKLPLPSGSVITVFDTAVGFDKSPWNSYTIVILDSAEYIVSPAGRLVLGDGTNTALNVAYTGSKYKIQEGVNEIAANAFYGCSNLVTITVPASVKIIGKNAFGECKNLRNVIYLGDKPIGDEIYASKEGEWIDVKSLVSDGASGWCDEATGELPELWQSRPIEYSPIAVASGTISADTVWKSKRIYRVSGDVIVGSGATLTIAPGAIVKFESGFSLTVNRGGTLSAIGTRAQPIVFTSIKDDEHGGDTNGDGDKTYPYAGDWYQIKVAGTADFNYCHVLYNSSTANYGGVEAYGGTINFDNSEIAHTKYECVNAHSSGNFTARNSVFRDSSLGFGYYGSGRVKAYNCVFSDLSVAIRQCGKTLANCVFYRCLAFTDQGGDGSSFSNCVFFNDSGYGAQSYTKCGSNGNIWGDPKFVDAENGDFRIKKGSPCINAGDSTNAPEFDYYGQPRDGAPEIGIYEVIGDSSTGYDLAASSVGSMGGSPVQMNAQAARSTNVANYTIGDTLDIFYVVTNVGSKAVSDPWHDALYLVSSSSGKQYALGELLNNGALGVNESRTSTVKFTVPVLPIGKYSIRLVVNSRRMDVPEGSATENNTAVSESEIEIVADSIDASQGASGSVSAGLSAVCAFTVPSGTGDKLMRVTSVLGGESLFARCGLGFLPVDAAIGTGLPFIGGVAYILVPAGIENVWVVLDNDGSSAASYEVEFIDGSMAIAQVSPSSIPSSGKVTVEIAGAGFTEDCEVSFTGASTVEPVSVKCVSQGLLAVTADAASFAPSKTYSVTIKKGSETKTLQNALSVAAAPGKPKFWAKLDVPSSMRQGRLVETCFIEYGNSGTADMISPVLQVSMIGDGTLGYMGGQSGLKTLQFIAAGDTGSAGVLRPGSSHRIRFAIRAGASNKISLHTSDGSDYAPAPWTNAADYLADLSAAATRVGLAGQDATDYPRCMELAKSSSGLSCVSGRILDRTYGILPGLKVTLAGESDTLDIYTDDKGRFFLDMVHSGTYDLILDGRIICKKDILISDRDLHLGDLEINADVDYVAYVDGVSPVEAGTMKLYGDDIMIAPIISGDTALFYNVSNGVYTIEYSDGENIAMQTVVINDESLASCYLVPEKIILEKIQFPDDFDMGKDTYYYVVGSNGLYYEGVQPVGSRIIEKPFTVGKYWITIYDEEQLLSSYIVEVSDESVDYTVVDAKKELIAAKSMALPREKLLNARGLSGNELINVRVENLCKEARALVQGLSIEEPLGDVFCTHSFAKMREDKLLLSDFKVRTGQLEYWLGITRGLYMKKHAKAIKAVFLGAADVIATVFGLPVTGLNDLFAEMSGDQEFSGKTAFLTVLDMTLDKPEETLNILEHLGEPISKEMSKKWLKTAPKLSTGLTLYGIIDRFSEIGDVSDEIDTAFAILATHADVFEQELREFKRAKESFNQYFSCCNQIFPEQPYEYRIDTTTPSIPKSCDPNEMVGEDGVGDARYVKPGQELTYTIYFENKQGFDIADAQEVRVTNPLSKWLDWSTFEMREVAFNNQNDVTLDGLANGTSEVRMNGTNKYVRTTVECDTKTGVVTWYMRVYDPNGDSEGYPTDGSGFLPSNDETHRGEGHLTYRIKLRDDAPYGVVVTNSASIVFDYNDPIETDPAWWNTVGVPGAGFGKSEINVEEGENVTFTVSGGAEDKVSSVKLYLTYNTASAADIDLKNGTVDSSTGGSPVANAQAARSTNLKFPFTLTWAAGEIGEKTITIPIKADKAIEDAEQFTLQLADPVGMELGEARLCTVTITDPGYAELETKIAAGTATKAEQTAWDKLQKAKAPYIRGVADPANAGKVTGSGLCASGKKVTLKAAANKGYVFTGWLKEQIALDGDRLVTNAVEYIATTPSLVIDRTAKPAKDTTTSTTLTNVNDHATFYAAFITTDEDKAAVGLTLNGGEVSQVEGGAPSLTTNIMCGVALNWPLASSALSATTVKVAGLPAGLKFTAKDIMKKGSKTEVEIPANAIYGAPTAASKIDKKTGLPVPSAVKVTVTTAGKSSVTYLMNITVDALPAWAVGNFEGFVRYDENDGGFATMSITAAGKVSGKIAYGGTNWTFKADSYDITSETVGSTNFIVETVAVSGKATRNLRMTITDIERDYLPDSAVAFVDGNFGNMLTEMHRLPWKDKGAAAAASLVASYAGAYSCRVPYGEDAGDVTFVLDEKGAVKGTVVLPDGAKTRKATFSSNALTGDNSLSVVIALPPDVKKGYPAVFKMVNLVNHSGEGADNLAFRDPGVVAAVAELTAESGATGTVSVNPKYGQVAPSKDVTLTAKAAKGSVFHRWEITGVDTEGLDLSSATLKFKMADAGDVFATAVFATTQEDAASLALDFADAITETDGAFSLDLGACVSSLSLAKLTVAGLPTGLKYDAKTMTISGKATKPGLYTVKVTAMNASATGKNAVVGQFTIEVPNFTAANKYFVDGLYNDIGEKYTLSVGISNIDDFLPSLALNSEAAKLAVSGLPSGLKYDATNGKITGVATKAGTYTITLTVTDGKAKYVSTITIEVEALPDWVVGTFYGKEIARGTGYYEWVCPMQITVTISAVGKISIKGIEPGESGTARSAQLTEVRDDGSYAFTVHHVSGRKGNYGYTEGDLEGVITPMVYGDNVEFGCCIIHDVGVCDEDDDPYESDGEAYQSLYYSKSYVSKLPAFVKNAVTTVNMNYMRDDDWDPYYGGYLTLKYGVNGAVTTAYSETEGGKATATGSAQLVPYEVDGNITKAWLYTALKPKGRDPFGVLLFLSIDTSKGNVYGDDVTVDDYLLEVDD